MLTVLKDLFVVFGRPARRRLGLLALATAVVAVLEGASVAVVLPFVQLVLDPDAAVGATGLRMAEAMGVQVSMAPVVLVGWVAFTLFVTATLLSALTAWMTFRIAAGENLRLSLRLLRTYMQQSYPFHLERNSAALSKNVIYEVDMMTMNLLVPVVTLVGRVMMVISTFAFLVYADPRAALATVGGVGVVYVVLYGAMKQPVARLSRRRGVAVTQRAQAVQEALGGVKETKVLGRESFFVDRFQHAAGEFAHVGATSQIIGSIPKFFLEAVTIGGALLAIVLLIDSGLGGAGLVPMLALYAAAAYRVMPAIQQIYTGATNVRYLADLVTMMKAEVALPVPIPVPHTVRPRLTFSEHLRLVNVSFSYPGTVAPTLSRVSLTIPKNSRLGIVGTTGSGKSTLVDVMLGLLTPSAGELRVDETPLDADNLRAWQDNVGYVPQTIYLSDDSIRRNIAFGVPEHEIDNAAVARAAALAGIHRFIVEESPEGYDTFVGERGVRLSGGQRQRIGIARALYRDPDVLILDEATSALDSRTEQDVMAAIGALSGRKTILIVAHRLSTIRECDAVVVVDRGEVVETGTYDDLVARGGVFSRLAQGIPA
ncbi:MAG: ABC transporter ATP-binding protein [Armatimonadetes bacterium]|nr:ABC transporter ATP-binding protein [Armatimonadota bacterium]